MSNARNILQSVNVEPSFDIEALANVVNALSNLDRDSTACAMAMAAGGNATNATRAALDAADISGTAARVLSRGESADLNVVRNILEAAAAAAERSANECGAHAEHSEHCRLHAESANQAAGLVRSLLNNLG
jgi:hypothetical protein